MNETAWSQQTYDISAVADNQATVFVRWGMGSTDSANAYSGWNIDDVTVTGMFGDAPPTVTSRVPAPGVHDRHRVRQPGRHVSETVQGVDASGPGADRHSGRLGQRERAPSTPAAERGGSLLRPGHGPLNISWLRTANDIEDSGAMTLAHVTWSYTVSIASGGTLELYMTGGGVLRTVDRANGGHDAGGNLGTGSSISGCRHEGGRQQRIWFYAGRF